METDKKIAESAFLGPALLSDRPEHVAGIARQYVI
jgi:hypothetical protein